MSPPPGDVDDAALVESALADVESAFTEIMRRHKGAVYRFIRRYVGDRDEAHDLVQETFVSAWTALPRFDGSRPLSAWLRRIALNKCRDWSRRRRVRSFFFTAVSLDVSPKALSATVEPTNVAQETLIAALDASLAALPTTLKEPLILTLFEGLSHKEAAALLRVSPKAIETRIYRARQMLAQNLSRQHASE